VLAPIPKMKWCPSTFMKTMVIVNFMQCPDSLGLEQIEWNLKCCLCDQQYILTHQVTQANIAKGLV